MTRETRIGLLVGLAFIVMFGLVLGWLNEPVKDPPQPVRLAEDTSYHIWPGRNPTEVDHPIELAAGKHGLDGGPAESPIGGQEVVESSFSGQSRGQVDEGLVDVQVHGKSPAEQDTALQGQTDPPAQADKQPAPVKYVVKPNDSLYKIAGRCYGDGNLYKRIFEANRNVLADENSLRVGQELVIPQLPPAGAARQPKEQKVAPGPTRPIRPAGGRHYRELEAHELPKYFADAAKQSAANRTYVVRPGDSLTAIARKLLKDDSRSAIMKIYSLNKDKLTSPNSLPVGVELSIPGGAGGA